MWLWEGRGASVKVGEQWHFKVEERGWAALGAGDKRAPFL